MRQLPEADSLEMKYSSILNQECSFCGKLHLKVRYCLHHDGFWVMDVARNVKQ
jgi:hypothetical protein